MDSSSSGSSSSSSSNGDLRLVSSNSITKRKQSRDRRRKAKPIFFFTPRCLCTQMPPDLRQQTRQQIFASCTETEFVQQTIAEQIAQIPDLTSSRMCPDRSTSVQPAAVVGSACEVSISADEVFGAHVQFKSNAKTYDLRLSAAVERPRNERSIEPGLDLDSLGDRVVVNEEKRGHNVWRNGI